MGAEAEDAVHQPHRCGPGGGIDVAGRFCGSDVQRRRFAFNAMEFNYKLNYVRNREGYTTRTYSGFIRIPQTRKSPSDRTLSDSADAYLEKITPPVPPGFERLDQSWTLDEIEVPGRFQHHGQTAGRYAPPPGCLKANVVTNGASPKHGGLKTGSDWRIPRDPRCRFGRGNQRLLWSVDGPDTTD